MSAYFTKKKKKNQFFHKQAILCSLISYLLSLISHFSFLRSPFSPITHHLPPITNISSLTFMGSIILLIKIGQPACSTLFSSAVSEYYYLRINFERTRLVRRIEGLSSAVILFTLNPTPYTLFFINISTRVLVIFVTSIGLAMWAFIPDSFAF